MAERTFIKFTFLKIDPAWLRREGELRAEDKRAPIRSRAGRSTWHVLDALERAATARPAPTTV